MRIDGLSQSDQNIYAGKRMNAEETEQRKSINANELSMGNNDGVLQGISKQLENAQEQLRTLADDSDMTLEQKMEKQKEINEEIANLNKQLAQRQMELREAEKAKQTEDLEEQAEKLAPKQETKEEIGIDSKKMDILTKASFTMDQVNASNRLKTKLQGEMNVAKIEAKLDGERGMDVTGKLGSINSLEEKVGKLEKKIGETMADIREEINEPLTEEEKAQIQKERVQEQKEIHEKQETKTEQYVPIDILL